MFGTYGEIEIERMYRESVRDSIREHLDKNRIHDALQSIKRLQGYLKRYKMENKEMIILDNYF